MKTSEKISKLMADLVPALSEIKAIKKDGKNPFLKNRYATLDGIIEGSKAILASHNVTAIQTTSDDGVETFLMHTSGEWISSGCMKIPYEQSKGLSIAQAIGVTITYAKRYQLGSMLGISTDDDVDGQFGDHTESHPVQIDVPARRMEPKTMEPQKITDERFKAAINMIMKGDEKSYKGIKTFALTLDQVDAVERAWEVAKMQVTVAEEV